MNRSIEHIRTVDKTQTQSRNMHQTTSALTWAGKAEMLSSENETNHEPLLSPHYSDFNNPLSDGGNSKGLKVAWADNDFNKTSESSKVKLNALIK